MEKKNRQLMLELRAEQPEDYETVEKLTCEAFANAPHAGGSEALLAHKLRDIEAFVPELDIVAVLDGEVVGSIMYTKSRVVGNENEWETLTFGPLSVLPSCQKQGIGAALVRHTLKIARRMDFRAVLIFGHESYYPRFGFANAAEFGVTTAEGENFDAFMALPLYDGALTGVHGRLIHDPIYTSLDESENEAFNRRLTGYPLD
ncbi:MAG: N-acetyltransferase [Synergistaceae bacterium]|jgi:predicted N-acetyltransferase YhbS|nr:N-acetyltransferase [Synergistaceae bacterium]